MTTVSGRSAANAASGCQPTASAAEEASSQSGIPNALELSLEEALRWWSDRLRVLAEECDAKGAKTGAHQSIMLYPSAATNIAHILLAAASAIEARRAATVEQGAVHESAGPQDDAHV